MIDLHTHILPGMDDGARDAEQSVQMLCREAADGVSGVALTPHFYPARETAEHFLDRRARAEEVLRSRLEKLPKEERETLPTLAFGAEVAWGPNIAAWQGLEKLCYEGTKYLLLELPFFPWDGALVKDIHTLMSRTGLTPMLAHIDRYFGTQKKERINEMLSLGLPVQISAEALLHRRYRRTALRLLESGEAQFIISDCHDLSDRAPNLGAAAELLRRRMDDEQADRILGAAL